VGERERERERKRQRERERERQRERETNRERERREREGEEEKREKERRSGGDRGKQERTGWPQCAPAGGHISWRWLCLSVPVSGFFFKIRRVERRGEWRVWRGEEKREETDRRLELVVLLQEG